MDYQGDVIRSLTTEEGCQMTWHFIRDLRKIDGLARESNAQTAVQQRHAGILLCLQIMLTGSKVKSKLTGLSRWKSQPPCKLYWFFTFDPVSRRKSCRWALVIPALIMHNSMWLGCNGSASRVPQQMLPSWECHPRPGSPNPKKGQWRGRGGGAGQAAEYQMSISDVWD